MKMDSPEHNLPHTEHEVNSAEGDIGLNDISFVFHGNSSGKDSERIEHEGMNVREGRATVSTDLAHALRWATTAEKRAFSRSKIERQEGEVGRVFVVKVPEALHLGYGVFTSMKVDEEHKEISGAPIKFTSGRKQLAFYETDDTETERRKIETEHKLGREPKSLNVPPENIVASIYPSSELAALVSQIQDSARSFDEPDIEEGVREAVRLIASDDRSVVAGEVQLEGLARQLISSTVESVAISRARNLALDVYRALGYKITKEDGGQDSKAVEPQIIKQRVQDMFEKTHADGFHLGPDWLESYLKDESEKLSVMLA